VREREKETHKERKREREREGGTKKNLVSLMVSVGIVPI
jgi:hypothetical protein